MKKVLLTGFNTHSSVDSNSAEVVAQTLHGEQIGKIHLYSCFIEKTFGDAIETVCRGMTDFKPDIVIMMGESVGRSMITLERVAQNLNDIERYNIKHQSGLNLQNEMTASAGPAAYYTRLPIRAMVREMRRRGIPADISDTTGTAYANHVFYGVLHYLSIHKLPLRAGWLNLPMLPKKAASSEFLGQPSMALHTSVEGVKLSIKAALEHETDISDSLFSRFQI